MFCLLRHIVGTLTLQSCIPMLSICSSTVTAASEPNYVRFSKRTSSSKTAGTEWKIIFTLGAGITQC